MHLPTLSTLLSILPLALSIPTVPPINSTGKPIHYAMLVFPGFQALDVWGPLDVINSMVITMNQTQLKLSIISRTLDPVTTVPQRSPMMNHTHGNFGTSVLPTTTFKDVLAKNEMKKARRDEGPGGHGGHGEHGGDTEDWSNIDVLFVPGGAGTRGDMTEEIAFVKEMAPNVDYLLSVCTGGTILARAGVLDGRNATSNKRAWPFVKSSGPNVNWIPEARWVDSGDGIWTSSGVSAGIDLTFAWVASLYGEEVADYIAINLEVERWRNATYDPFAKIWELV